MVLSLERMCFLGNTFGMDRCEDYFWNVSGFGFGSNCRGASGSCGCCLDVCAILACGAGCTLRNCTGNDCCRRICYRGCDVIYLGDAIGKCMLKSK